MSVVQTELEASRRLFLNRRPFFAPFLLRCQLFLVDGDELFCDCHWRIYVGRKWSVLKKKKLPKVSLLAAGIYHELLHLLQNHFRRGTRLCPIDEESWRLACECEINDDLIADLQDEKAGGMLFPTEGIFPKKLKLPDGLMAEEYWTLLHERRQRSPQPNGLAACVSRWLSPGRVEPGKCCGGGSGAGKAHPDELPAGDPAYPSPTEMEKAAALREFAQQAVAWHNERAAGTLPGWLQQLADAWAPAPVPWYRRLEKHLREALTSGGDDYSWQRPNRRNLSPDQIVTPGLVAHSGELGILVDTSGSISDADLNEAFGTIKGILRRISGSGSFVRLLACDTMAKDAGRIRSTSTARLQDLELPRGGGTDMRAGIALAESIGLRCLLVLTDGFTPWPEQKPRPPVLVALIGSHSRELPWWAMRVQVEKC